MFTSHYAVCLVGQCNSLVFLNKGYDSVSQQGDDTSTIGRSGRDKHDHLLDAINVIQSAHITRVNLAQYLLVFLSCVNFIVSFLRKIIIVAFVIILQNRLTF